MQSRPAVSGAGSFKGAHYVTEEEEGFGLPGPLVHFLLYLKSYGDLATVNDDNLGPAVHFVPCNLLEMLYAFVFSQEYGVALSGDRYPVTFYYSVQRHDEHTIYQRCPCVCP